MRFITEQDLRKEYEAAPFASYEPPKDTKLTPGARQYLNDRRVRIVETIRRNDPVIRNALRQEICCPSANPAHNPKAGECGWRKAIALDKTTVVGGMFCRAKTCFEASGVLEANSMRALCEEYEGIAQRIKQISGAHTDSCGGCEEKRCKLSQESRYISCAQVRGQEIVSLKELNVAVCSLKCILTLALADQPEASVCNKEIVPALEKLRGDILRLIEKTEMCDEH